MAGQNGYVQVRCVDNWGSAHIEWCGISTADMMCGTKYHLQLHVEGNKQLASEWKQELESKPLLLPKGAALSNTSRIMKWDVSNQRTYCEDKRKRAARTVDQYLHKGNEESM